MNLVQSEIKKRLETKFAPGWYPRVEIEPGWLDIVDECDRQLEELIPGYRLLQVKEKFGGLRYYIDTVPSEYGERVQEIINDAERRSMETCEVCGNAGETRKRQAWYSTLCDDCAERQ